MASNKDYGSIPDNRITLGWSPKMMLHHNRLNTNLQSSSAGMNRNTLDRAPNIVRDKTVTMF
jgi:hypothetical protein